MIDPTSPAFEPLFVVGCPRSGTTWLQLLLAQHPKLATVRETHAVSWYLRGFFQRWQLERSLEEEGPGLRALLSDEGLTALSRSFLGAVFGEIAARTPGASVLMDKSPDHVFDAPEILRVYPRARFIHVVRDPRAVVASLRSAGNSWGSDWVPEGAVGCAELWRDSVKAGRAIADLTDAVREVRYETLLAAGTDELASVFSWIGLEADAAFCERAIELCRFDRLQSGSDAEARRNPCATDTFADGFFRRGRADAWREDLSPEEAEVVEWRTFELMVELGYRPVAPSKPDRPARVNRWRRRRRLARRLGRLAERLAGDVP